MGYTLNIDIVLLVIVVVATMWAVGRTSYTSRERRVKERKQLTTTDIETIKNCYTITLNSLSSEDRLDLNALLNPLTNVDLKGMVTSVVALLSSSDGDGYKEMLQGIFVSSCIHHDTTLGGYTIDYGRKVLILQGINIDELRSPDTEYILDDNRLLVSVILVLLSIYRL